MKNELKIFENEAFGKVRVIEKIMSRGLQAKMLLIFWGIKMAAVILTSMLMKKIG